MSEGSLRELVKAQLGDGRLPTQPPRRVYLADKQRIVDMLHQSSMPWDKDLVEAVNAFTALNMRAELMKLVLE